MILNPHFIHSLMRHPGASDVPEQAELLGANPVALRSIPGTQVVGRELISSCCSLSSVCAHIHEMVFSLSHNK